ncbi:M1 family metallopeptidase [Streptomyces sp. AM 2-1-1]|uniref:M1 family metallopeptidase n=1 Tax=Streptomyces sp. AM 2-1-1 TaxID=3028709 RepID=UPI0023B93445|nr:M1 family metallopeptidase [Streptomyces sp. AM 2-1-1]WEH41141.1 M1 family metallopeptidase [Streptomyces sp. AM 2-1-1]
MKPRLPVRRRPSRLRFPARPGRAAASLLACAVLGSTASACTGGGAEAGAGATGTPGAAGVGDPYFPKLGNGGYDVTHYDLRLAVDRSADRLTGTATITSRATQDLSAFDLDLLGLDVAGATVEGRPAAVRRTGGELVLRPDAEVADHLRGGRTFTTVVRYSGAPRTLTDADGSREGWVRTADGAVALGEPAGGPAWFPGNHHPSDKATYTVAVTVPEELTAVSNGELTSRRTGGAPGSRTTTYTWRTAQPMASYLATVAIGRFRTKESRTGDGLTVFTAVDSEVAAEAEPRLARIPEIVAWEAGKFGPYPFRSTGAIVDRAEDSDYALETQNRPYYPGPPTPGLLVHEMAHQWFGDSVTPADWRDMWLNEGFATYAEWLWSEEKEGVPAERSFDEAYADDANWAFPPARPPDATDLSQPPVYGRGAMVVHRLRRAVDDDEAFFALLAGWTGAHRYGNASTADFTAYAEKATGLDLSRLWSVWLYGDGRPEDPAAPDLPAR